jgi:hypothetical protein
MGPRPVQPAALCSRRGEGTLCAAVGTGRKLFRYFFFMPRRRPRPATVFFGPLRVRALVRVR